MNYRIQANIIFPNPQQATAAYNALSALFQFAITLNPGTDHAEHSLISYHACQHGQPQSSPCTVIDEQETP